MGELAGLEIALVGNEIMHRETGREIFKPARCHVMKVRAGDYGRKTDRDFYEYKHKQRPTLTTGIIALWISSHEESRND